MPKTEDDMGTRPNLNDPAADTTTQAVARALADELDRALETADADRYDSWFAADVLWGKPFGALVVGHDQINAIHRQMMRMTKPVAPASPEAPAPGCRHLGRMIGMVDTFGSVESATTADVEALAAVLAEAFTDDPVMGWLVPKASRRPAALRAFFDFQARHHALHFDASLLARIEGQVVAAALVLPPGSWKTPFDQQARHGAGFTAIFRTRLPHALRLQTEMDRRHPREPHYYLPCIGTLTAFQGLGTGGRILRRFTSRCDGEQQPAYLEATNPDNARLYRRHGFETIGFLDVADCPPLERMWRQPTGPQ
ncbi:MAG: hypothetical protein J2P18_07215 [Nocardia sp.]|nr:hypothetical protein [Nocardia sp.]